MKNIKNHKSNSEKAFTCFAVITISAAILVLANPSNATAQTPGIPFKPKVYIGGGYAPIVSPDSSFKAIFDPSVSLQASVGLPLSPGLEIIAKFQYHNLSINPGGYAGLSALQPSLLNSLGLTDPGRTITMLGVDAKFPLGPSVSPLRPYFLIGGGSFTMKQNAVNESVTLTNPPSLLSWKHSELNQSDVYFNLGFGADIKIGPTLGFFIEGKYTILNTPSESSAIMPIIVGLRLF